jgi:hypothetical protein
VSGRDSFPGSERTLKLKDYEIDKKSVTAKFPDLTNSKTDQHGQMILQIIMKFKILSIFVFILINNMKCYKQTLLFYLPNFKFVLYFCCMLTICVGVFTVGLQISSCFQSPVIPSGLLSELDILRGQTSPDHIIS